MLTYRLDLVLGHVEREWVLAFIVNDSLFRWQVLKVKYEAPVEVSFTIKRPEMGVGLLGLFWLFAEEAFDVNVAGRRERRAQVLRTPTGRNGTCLISTYLLFSPDRRFTSSRMTSTVL